MLRSLQVLQSLFLSGRVIGSIVAVLVAIAPASAQQTGTLTGLVRDAQGGVLPGVTVTATGETLIGGSRTSVTGDAGSYQFALPPGSYTVAFELAGFAPLRREGIAHFPITQIRHEARPEQFRLRPHCAKSRKASRLEAKMRSDFLGGVIDDDAALAGARIGKARLAQSLQGRSFRRKHVFGTAERTNHRCEIRRPEPEVGRGVGEEVR